MRKLIFGAARLLAEPRCLGCDSPTTARFCEVCDAALEPARRVQRVHDRVRALHQGNDAHLAGGPVLPALQDVAEIRRAPHHAEAAVARGDLPVEVQLLARERFGLRRVHVVTLQALSGAGLSGPSGFEMLDNLIPFISGEEEKLEQETVERYTERLGRQKEQKTPKAE